MNNEDADIEALSAEVDAIEERKTALINAEEQRKALAEKVANDNTAKVVEERKEKIKMDNMEVRNSKAYIDAYANYIKTEDDTECRSLLTENVSGSVPVPEFVYDIVKTAWEREGIMSRVRKAYLKGNLKVGFEYGADPAVVHTEGGNAVTEESLSLGVVTIVPASIKKWISVSDEVVDMRGEEFLRYILEEMDRSGTYIKTSGMYTNAEKEMIFLVVPRHELVKVQRAIKEYDPSAFMVVANAYNTYGEGFKPMPEKHELENM
jgi:HK97 family phage major capsid protein